MADIGVQEKYRSMVKADCNFTINEPNREHPWEGTSHWSSKLIFMFLESVEEGEWENTQS